MLISESPPSLLIIASIPACAPSSGRKVANIKHLMRCDERGLYVSSLISLCSILCLCKFLRLLVQPPPCVHAFSCCTARTMTLD